MTGKYPADIIETVAKAVADAQNVPFPGAKQRKIAVAALDALGLTVTEEWAIKYDDGDVDGPIPEDYARTSRATEMERYPVEHREHENYVSTLVRRSALHADTPWVEVPDAE